MSDRLREASAATDVDWALLASSPREALRFRLLFPAWILTTALVGLLDTAPAGYRHWLLIPALWLGAILGASWVAPHAVRDFGWQSRSSWTDHLRIAGRTARISFLLQAGYLLLILLLAAIASLGLLLRWIPAAGDFLSLAYLLTVGLAASLLAAALAVVAPFLFSLIAPCAASQPPETVVVFWTCGSYLRGRPLRYFLGLAAILLSTAVALLPFTLTVSLAVVGLRCIHLAGEGAPLGASDLLAEIHDFFAPSGNFLSELFVGADGWARALIVCFLLAYALVSLAVGLSRLFLLLRCEIDGVARGDGGR